MKGYAPPLTKSRMLLAALSLATVLVATLASCVGVPAKTTEKGPRFTLALKPGASYKTETIWFLFKLPIYPQVAVWVETPEGRYLDTLYVTAKGERENWIGAPKKGRPEALPVWRHARTSRVDGVSAATSPGPTLRAFDLAARLPAGDYIVKLETNRSYDYNDIFTSANSGVSGQPSLIYTAAIAIGGARTEARFEPMGTGSVDGSKGDVRAGLDGITTALDLFSSMTIAYETD